MTSTLSEKFEDDFDTDPPTPIQSKGRIGNGCYDKSNIPEKLFPEEHTAEVGDQKVIRSGWECPRCGSNIFLHPKYIVPHNNVYCFQCSYASFNLVWWEDARLPDILPDE